MRSISFSKADAKVWLFRIRTKQIGEKVAKIFIFFVIIYKITIFRRAERDKSATIASSETEMMLTKTAQIFLYIIIGITTKPKRANRAFDTNHQTTRDKNGRAYSH